jgi:hypothetical protein
MEVRWRSLFRSTSPGKLIQLSTQFSKTCCLGAPFSCFEKHRNRVGRDLDCMADVLMGFYQSTFFQAEHRIQFRSRPMRFLGISNHEKGAPRQEISKWSTVCSTFSRNGWSVVRSASLAKGGTSKERPSPHLHKVPTRSNKVSPRTLQTVFVLQRTALNEIMLLNCRREQSWSTLRYYPIHILVQKYNFTCCFVRVWDLVFHTKGRI